MADRNRRKSSILKLPKSNARAPLQDVNTLDVKASQDEDFTSHTALARRRVSFAGKNFVKEFCSEADIASVYHAPEYEELLASAESSGLVTSDSSSNTHSSTTIGENNSTFGSRTQNSASKGDNIQDGYDPCDEIMQMFKGSKSTHTEPLKPTGKLRLSFGDICIPNFEDENDLPMAPAGNCQTSTSHSGKDARENFLITRVTNTASSSVVKSQVKNSQVSFQHGNDVGQEHKTNTKVTKTEVPSVIVCAEARQSAQAKRFIYQDIKTLPSTQSSSPSLVGSLGENVSFEDEVFESPKSCLPQGGNKMVFSDESCSAKDSVNAAHSAAKASQISIDLFSNERANCDLADTTQCMNESMDFTKAVPGIIHLGCLENPVADSMHETMALETSMEFTKCLPSNIQEGFATSKSIEIRDDKNGVANHTLAMSTSMEFTRPVPSKIEVGFGGIENIQSNEENVAVNPSRTVAMSTSLELTRPMSCHVPIGSASIQNENIFTDENGQENNSVNINEPSVNGKCLQNIMEDSKTMDRSGIFVEQTSMEQTVDYSAKIEDTFAFVADPFQSKPCLASSPCAQSGIEALLSHSLVKKNTGQDRMEIDHFVGGKSLPIDSNNFVTICSEPQEKALLEQCNLSVKTPSEKTSSPRIPSSTGTSVGKPPLIQEGLPQSRTPDKITCTVASGLEMGSSHMDKSNPFLDISDPFKPKAKICNTPIKPSNELLSSSSKRVGVRKDDAQSTSLNVHRDNEKDQCMLLDEPPPFQDVPSFSMDISASVNDSGANLLHNTIKNAEITLQGILSPDFKKMQPEAAWEEGMDCDPIPHEGITKEQTCSTLMPSSEVDSRLCHQSTSYEGGADVISILKSREGAEKIENTKNAQRPQDDSLNHRTVDPERSDDTVSTKRLCPFTPEAVNAKHQKTLNPKLGSDLATEISHIFSPNSSVENSRTASTSADLSLHLDDVIFNLKSFMWKACKIDEDFWSFKYNYHCLELKIHLKLSSTTEGIVEGSNGQFVSHVTDSTKPVTRWGMDILMAKLKTREWDSFLHHSPNFLEAMGNLDKLVSQNKRFLVETITQEGFLNLKFKQDSFSGYITSEKLQLLFQVTLKLDLLEKYTPHHIQVLNVIGEVRETEVKNLITGVKKDLFFIRNYFRDVKDYVKTLESFL